MVLGGLALTRFTRQTGNRTLTREATAAIVAGLAGVVIGGLVVAAADGGPGTGYGIVGGFLALVVGLIAMGLGSLALIRSKRTA